VMSRSDSGYPERLKRYLAQSAPPLLYGVGCQDLLNRGGLAVVGSRDRSEDDAAFARCVGEQCAQEGVAVISGEAKGIDRDAMSGALDAGGWALGVLAEGLAKTATSGQYREGLVSDHLTLVSPYDPDSRWFAYAAMERNKLLYGLSDAALVVASSADSGGTWAGATEALQHGKVKVFVKSTGVLAPGNLKLVRLGGIPFPPQPWANLQDMFTPPEEKNRGLFSETPPVGDSLAESIADTPGSRVLESPLHGEAPSAPAPPTQRAPIEGLPARDAYPLVIDTIVALLQEPQADELLAAKMCVRAAQVKDWLERGVREGRISKLKKPVRYVANVPTLFAK
jgi:predicted Rossmann fold nucleotide-binding protein DprA/Smf involved in DNA uptake